MYILGLFLCCYSVGGIFLPSALMSKIRISNETDLYEKVWIKYIEKRLETTNMHLEKQKDITSFLDSFKRYFRKNLFKKLRVNCEQLGFNSPAGIGVGIYGKICISSNGVKNEKEISIDSCLQKINSPEKRYLCFIFAKFTAKNGKYKNISKCQLVYKEIHNV